MNYWKNSLIYKILSGSWLFSWLLLAPEDKSAYIAHSFVYKAVSHILKSMIRRLHKWCVVIEKLSKGSLLIGNLYFIIVLLLTAVGISCFRFPLRLSSVIVGTLILLAVFMTATRKLAPQTWENSLIVNAFAWWRKD